MPSDSRRRPPEDRAFLDGVLEAAGYVEKVLHDASTADKIRATRQVLLADFRACTADMQSAPDRPAHRAYIRDGGSSFIMCSCYWGADHGLDPHGSGAHCPECGLEQRANVPRRTSPFAAKLSLAKRRKGAA